MAMGSSYSSLHIFPVALSDQGGTHDEIPGGLAGADPRCRGHSMTQSIEEIEARRRLGRTVLHISLSTLMALQLFKDHQWEFIVLSSQIMFVKRPKLSLTSCLLKAL